MSKSDPNSAIFMEDPEAEVKTKIKKAFCPPGVVEGNPCLAYIQHIVLPWNRSLEVSRSEQNGGNKYGSSGVPGRDIESRRSVLSQRSGSHAPTYASLRKPARLILTPHPSTPRRTYDSFEDLKADYESGALHPSDLKPALAKAINAILQVRATWSPYPDHHNYPSHASVANMGCSLQALSRHTCMPHFPLVCSPCAIISSRTRRPRPC